MNLCDKLSDTENIRNKVIKSDDGYRLYSKDKGMDGKPKHRYYYYEEIPNVSEGKKATVIMINPSEKNESGNKKSDDGPDNTISNLRKILSVKNGTSPLGTISSFEVLNLFSTINSSPEEAIKNDIVDAVNKDVIKKVIEEANIVIPAWGVEKKYKQQNAIDLIAEIKEWCKDKKVFVVTNKFPCHFSLQCTSPARNPEFVEYKF